MWGLNKQESARIAEILSEPVQSSAPALPVIPVSSLADASPSRFQWHDGEKFPGGFGFTNLLTTDYWTLRARSSQLFKTNIYARGIIRRLVTNIINVGLHLEAVPDESILGINEDNLADWAELVENRFALWEGNPNLCDVQGRNTFGALQVEAKREALVAGDVLVTLQQDRATWLPKIRLISGAAVQSPLGDGGAPLQQGHRIVHGVELDPEGRQVAYWIRKDDGKANRLPAKDSNGRPLAWLVYGTDKRLDEVRGEPLLSIVLQSLLEIDRYRDSVQRKATVNAIFAMVVEREQETLASTLTSGGGARVRSTEIGTGGTEQVRDYNFFAEVPGRVPRLAPGESLKGFPATGTDEKFSDFEAAIVYAVAWSLEIPPETLTLSFQSNYSASQAATNEFKNFLNPVRKQWGDEFCQPIYNDWLISEALSRKIDAPGLLESWRDPKRYDEYSAWISADWCGAIKPSIDMVKQGRGYRMYVEDGFISRDRAARETTGTKFSKNAKKLKRENEQLLEAWKPLKEIQEILSGGTKAGQGTGEASGAQGRVLQLVQAVDELSDRLDDVEDERTSH